MSPQSSAPVQRTAPIAIAPKPPRPEPSPYRHDSFHRLEMGHGVASSAPVEGSSFNASSIPPCLSCRYSRVNCILNDDDDGCIQCQAAGSECSLSSSPQSRKRKLNGDASEDIIGKRRSEQSKIPIFIPISIFMPKSPPHSSWLDCSTSPRAFSLRLSFPSALRSSL
jgi:hypothetical protein